MDFIDLAAQQKLILGQLEGNIKNVLNHGQYVMGPEIKVLEKKLASYVGVKHAIGCASGTDALLMALMAYGIGPGDAVFTTPFTFIATAEVIALLGATPVFVDIDPDTFNISPVKLEQAITALKTQNSSLYPLPVDQKEALVPKGIIPVDLFGLPADYDRIGAIAKEHNLFIIEDAAQSFGGDYYGKKACALGNIACTSFFPAKPLGCYGDGGMCFTGDDGLANVMESIRIHGKGDDKYDNIRIGINGRLDTLQAAILLAKFDIFPDEIEKRREAACQYNDLIEAVNGSLVTPKTPEGFGSAWAQYSLLAQDEKTRNTLMSNLKKQGIPTAIYYPKPLHMQTAFAGFGYCKGAFPVCEDCADRIFSLPMHPYLSLEVQQTIARGLVMPVE
ncbi:MAG: UDP-2-acetamido-2-deoxy-3-oxo-D-glucuronate aminotransferase [Syntrophus sp. SKADARSKE-3]|nr:UDP-2-acetamido-2-deoxy-3-oxo-D-glucuronate aminotransferase [Syntrophus sp. SKADARSKE-3]